MRWWWLVLGLLGCRPFPDALPPCAVGGDDCGEAQVCDASGRCVPRGGPDLGGVEADAGLDLDLGPSGDDAGRPRDAEAVEGGPTLDAAVDAELADAEVMDAEADAMVPDVPECGCDAVACYVEIGCDGPCRVTAPTIADALQRMPLDMPLIITHCDDDLPFDVTAREVTLRAGGDNRVDIDAAGGPGVVVRGGGRLTLVDVRVHGAAGAAIAIDDESQLTVIRSALESSGLGLDINGAEVNLEDTVIQGNRGVTGTTAGVRCRGGQIIADDVAIQSNRIASPEARAGAIDAVGCDVQMNLGVLADNEVQLDLDAAENVPDPAGAVWIERGRFTYREGTIGPDTVRLPRAMTTASVVSVDAHVQLAQMEFLGLSAALGTVHHVEARGGARPVELTGVAMVGLDGMNSRTQVRLNRGLLIVRAVPDSLRVVVVDLGIGPTEVPDDDFYCVVESVGSNGSCREGPCVERCPEAWPCEGDDVCEPHLCTDGFCQ